MQQNSNVCIITARKRSWGKVMFLHMFVILFTGGWYPSMHCRWYPSMPCRSPGPHPRGKFRSLAWGVSRPTPSGVSRPTPGGGYPGPHPGGYPSMHWGRHPLPHTATAAGSTHPTGMHSCFLQMIASSNSLCGGLTESTDSERDCNYIKFNT